MAISGPRTHHHDDDTGEGGPAVFADINITPLTDIFLVLLIIFMVTSTALVEAGQGGAGAGVRVDLPKGAARELLVQLAQQLAVAVLRVPGEVPLEVGDAIEELAQALLRDRLRGQAVAERLGIARVQD